MKVLMALFGCNVSLMDRENFVFELMTPLKNYPLSFATFVREEETGTGTAATVAYEKKPLRVDAYEHYRAVGQRYAGVSVPYIGPNGKYFGAMNIISPHDTLPSCALEVCDVAVKLAIELYRASNKREVLLSTIELFKPLFLLFESPLLIIDQQGHILTANSKIRSYCPGWENFSYGSQSLDDYLSNVTPLSEILSLSENFVAPKHVVFNKGKKRGGQRLNIVRMSTISIDGQEPFIVCVFEDTDKTLDETTEQIAKPRRAGACLTSDDGAIDYIGKSAAWQEINQAVDKVATANVSVLLLGETGTGKEVVAKALHRRSGRKGEFVAVNCGAIPRDLLASELFGYEGGAFTGARESGVAGKFEFSDQGTLFLDEIGEMPVGMQVSLLRVLQEHSVTRLGSNKSRQLDVRVIAATNRSIDLLIEEGRLRLDLYYRLSLVELRLPELRKRTSDVPLLAEYFNEMFSRTVNQPYTPFPRETLEALVHYSWPGNVRELRNFVERSLVMHGEGSRVTPDTLPPYLSHAGYGDLSTSLSIDTSSFASSETQELVKNTASTPMTNLPEFIELYQRGNLETMADLGTSVKKVVDLLDFINLEMQADKKEAIPHSQNSLRIEKM